MSAGVGGVGPAAVTENAEATRGIGRGIEKAHREVASIMSDKLNTRMTIKECRWVKENKRKCDKSLTTSDGKKGWDANKHRTFAI